MACDNTYDKKYINECRSRIDRQVIAYQMMIRSIKCEGNTQLSAAINDFAASLFNNLLLAMDRCFVHRARDREGNDGNPLNEVRMLCDAITENSGVLSASEAIRYEADRSVLRYRIGDEINLTEADFISLTTAFFRELEERYLAT